MKDMTRTLNARELRWVGGIHRNTNNPHVHLLIHRDYLDRQTGQAKHLKTLPKEWRVGWEKKPDGERVTHPGLFSQTFEKHLAQRVHQFQQNQRAKHKEESQDRLVLGKAMMVTESVQHAQGQLLRLEEFGAWRRYRIVDAQGRSRRLSEADLRRRVVFLKESNPRAAIIEKICLARFAEQSKLELKLSLTRIASQPVLAAAQQITECYVNEGKPLPVPLLTRANLAHLQQRALMRGDAEQLRLLETMRVSLAAEKGGPTRSEGEVARLRAQLFVARSGLWVEEQSVARFEATKHLRQWRTSHAEQRISQSLVQLEAARVYAVDQAKFIGARRLHWEADKRAQAREQAEVLQQRRAEVLQLMDDERARLIAEIARRTETVNVLQEIYAGEKLRYQEQGLPLPAPRFTGQEMRELDAHAARRHDADFYRTLYTLERDFDLRSGRSEKEVVRERFRRATAREIIADLTVRESAERIERFHERRSLWMVVTHESRAGGLTLARLSDVEARAPIEQLFQPLLTRTVKYKAVAAAVQAWEQRLQEQHAHNQAAHTYLSETARQSAKEFNQHLPGQPLPAPHFTARELQQLELHLRKENDPVRREHYARVYQEALPTNSLDTAPTIRLDTQETKDWLIAEQGNLHDRETSFER